MASESKGADTPPNQTLYIHNLNEKVKKDALKKALYSIFSQYGPILDIIASRKVRLRGQAWIVFKDVSSATTAMRQMQGFAFYDKPMEIQFAKTKSDAAAKADGSFRPREKRHREETPATSGQGAKRTAVEDADSGRPRVVDTEPAPPNNVLFVQNLPAESTDSALNVLFQPYPGLKDVRVFASKGFAFVEFDDAHNAGVAMQGVQGYKMAPGHDLRVSYAKQ